LYSANRKKADAHKTGVGPAPPPLTEAEELALNQNIGRPVAEGIPEGAHPLSPPPKTPPSAFIKCNRPIDIFFKPIHTNVYLSFISFFLLFQQIRWCRSKR